MNDRHDEAEDIRAETAENSPELQEHDQFAELQAKLEEAQRRRCMPPPRCRTCAAGPSRSGCRR